MRVSIKSALLCFAIASAGNVFAKSTISDDKFRQLEENLPTPNTYRTASGAPGHEYWQQQVNYKIDIAIDDKTQRLTGSESITYTNNSPDTLRYIWIQLDQNRLKRNSNTNQENTGKQKKNHTIQYRGCTNI